MSSKREQLINTATKLYAERGYHATGIDTILAESGIAKKTLYNHFRKKEELILAVLRQQDGEFRNYFMRQVETQAQNPKDRLLAIFDVAEQWFSQKNFFGCMFINAIGEYSGKDTPIRDACREYKKLMRDYIQSLAEDAGASDPTALADELALLLEGAIVTAQVSERIESAKTAKKIAKMLIADAID
ncbi:MAG: AcrR family transcriptional regulator [Planctomycetota bacterium]|jgi:AcrR family transcriptional regulator